MISSTTRLNEEERAVLLHGMDWMERLSLGKHDGAYPKNCTMSPRELRRLYQKIKNNR